MSTPFSVRGAAIGMLFDDFFRSEYPRLVPMLHGVVGDRGQAEDLAQEALAIAQREWDKVRDSAAKAAAIVADARGTG